MTKGQPISVRLDDEVERLVDEERRRSGRSRSAIVEELAEEAAKTRLFPGIAFRGPRPRRAWVIGTALDVWELVELVRGYDDLERLMRDFPLVSEPAVRVALAYAERFSEEIETAIADNARSLEQMGELYPFVDYLGRR